MSTQQLNAQLMRILKFDDADLDANRQGRMTIGQRTRLLIDNRDVLFILLIIFGAPISLVGIIARQGVALDQILAVVAIEVIAIIFGRNQLRQLWEAVLGHVSKGSGITKFQVQVYAPQHDLFRSMMGEKWAYGVIESTTFHVPVEMAEQFEGKKLCVYYTQELHKTLSAEVIA